MEGTISGSRLRILAIFLLGAGLRVFWLDRESIWIDEGFTAQIGRLDLQRLLRISIQYDKIPPFYTLLLHGWVGLVGDSVAAMRLLSALFGALCVPALYRVARAWSGNEDVAWMSALLLALSPFHIRYSQEIRAYSLLTLLALLSMHAFLAWLREPRPGATLCYLLPSCLLVHTHVYGIFVVLAQNLFVLLGSRRHWKAWLLAQLALGVLFLPWALFLMGQIEDVQRAFWIPAPTLGLLLDTLVEASGSATLAGLFCACAALNLARGERRGPEVLIVWLLTPVLVPFVLSFVLRPIYFPRYTIEASPALYILVASGLSRGSARFWRLGFLVGLCALILLQVRHGFGERRKEEWRETVFMIEAHARKTDAVLVHSGWCLDLAYNVYSVRKDVPRIPFPPRDLPITDEELQSLEKLLEGRDRVWFVEAYGKDSHRRIPGRLLELGFFPDTSWHPMGIQVTLYSKRF